MWKRLAIVSAAYAAVFAVLIGAEAITFKVHAVQATDHAQRVAAGVRVGEAVIVERDQALALDAATAELNATQKALTASTGERAQLQAKINDQQGQIDKLTNQLAAVGGGVGGGRLSAMSLSGNHFPFGWCTYYVASRRYVPWNGNAITWLWGARAFGFPTGSAPRVGAIMVSAESVWGHVAYVEAVSSSGSFVVSEMNFNAWGVVDFRTVVPGKVPVLGFIY